MILRSVLFFLIPVRLLNVMCYKVSSHSLLWFLQYAGEVGCALLGPTCTYATFQMVEYVRIRFFGLEWGFACFRSSTADFEIYFFLAWRLAWTSTCPSSQREALDCPVTSKESSLAFCLQREKSRASLFHFGSSTMISSLRGKLCIYTRNWITQRTVSGKHVTWWLLVCLSDSG